MRRSAASRSPTSLPPTTRFDTPSGKPFREKTSCAILWHAIAVSGVFSDGFHTTVSPHTHASIAFHAHTATGKLNAVITPTTPSGCHCSYIRCIGRSLCIVSPYSCRESPTAKSQMSIISCTSPRPSARIFPTSSDTRSPRRSRFARSASPSWRTISPRLGAGSALHRAKADCAAVTACSYSSAPAWTTRPRGAPVPGEREWRDGPVPPRTGPPVHVPGFSSSMPRPRRISRIARGYRYPRTGSGRPPQWP